MHNWLYAFLVACAGYNKTELQPIKDDVTINDILEFKRALLETGFAEENIVILHDKQTHRRYLPEHDKIVKELDLFLDGLKPEDTVLVVLSGHGVLFKGDKTGYFCPVDAKISTKEKLIPMEGSESLYAQLEKCKAGRKLLIANACRNEPAADAALAGDRIKLEDDYPEAVPNGIAAIYSCEAGQKSYFDTDRKRSLFFIHLTNAWRGKYHTGNGLLTLEAVFDQTRVKTKVDANKTFGEKQSPVVRRGYEGDWAIGVVKSGDITKDAKTYTSKTTGMKFVQVKAGSFTMGSSKDEKDRRDDENARDVDIARDYYLGAFEVTRGQFQAFVDDTGYKTEAEAGGKGGAGWDAAKGSWVEESKYTWRNPGFEQTDDHPVVMVSWNDARNFCKWLSQKDGKSYRLPSEAEWEYACRAGTTSRFPFGDDEEDMVSYGNVADKDFRAATGTNWGIKGSDGYSFTAPVGKFKANSWGLHDMHGNVWEWCRDCYGPYDRVPGKKDPVQLIDQFKNHRVLRGGCLDLDPSNCRSANRGSGLPEHRSGLFGFRVCLSLDSKLDQNALHFDNADTGDAWIAVHYFGQKKEQSATLLRLKSGSKFTLAIYGDDAWVRVVKNGKAIASDRPKGAFPFCDVAPFGVWQTDNQKVVQLRSTKPGEKEVVIDWEIGTPLPNGWSFYDHYRYEKDETIVIK